MPDNNRAILNCLTPAEIQAHRRIKLKRLTAGRHLRITDNYSYLLTQLINKNDSSLCRTDRSCHLSESLRHEPSLKSDMTRTHLTINLRLRNQRGHRVNNDNIDNPRPYHHVSNLQCLLTCIRLRQQKMLSINPQSTNIREIESVLSINHHRTPACPLRTGNSMRSQRSFPGHLRTKNLHHPATRQATDAKCHIQGNRT